MSDMMASGLRCEYARNPISIDIPYPRLSWEILDGGNGRMQSAYRILVSSTVEMLERDEGNLWDTNKVFSSETANIHYEGKSLSSFEQCFWKVVVWDECGEMGLWSEVNRYNFFSRRSTGPDYNGWKSIIRASMGKPYIQ